MHSFSFDFPTEYNSFLLQILAIAAYFMIRAVTTDVGRGLCELRLDMGQSILNNVSQNTDCRRGLGNQSHRKGLGSSGGRKHSRQTTENEHPKSSNAPFLWNVRALRFVCSDLHQFSVLFDFCMCLGLGWALEGTCQGKVPTRRFHCVFGSLFFRSNFRCANSRPRSGWSKPFHFNQKARIGAGHG